MDISNASDDIFQMRWDESVYEYMYHNGIDQENIYDHLSELRQQFGMNPGFSNFLHNMLMQPRFMLAADNMPSGQRMGMFIHPRFLPDMPHSHDYFELKYMLHGTASMITDNASLTLKESDLCFIAPDTIHHTLIFDSDVLLMNIEMRSEEVANLLPRLLSYDNPLSSFFVQHMPRESRDRIMLYHTEGSDLIKDLIMKAYHAEYTSAGSYESLLLSESYIEQMLLMLITRFPDPDPDYRSEKGSNLINQLLTYTKKHLADIRFSDLASVFHYSESYLSRYIKKHTGRSFSSLLSSYRINEAANLLLHSALPVDDVMKLCGYSGKTNFHKLFRSQYGESPAEYRKNHRLSQ